MSEQPATAAEKTDWTRYYDRPAPTARFSRRVTEAKLVETIRQHAPGAGRALRVIELGGANSCFFDRLRREFQPREYHVVDFNARGLELFRQRVGDDPSVILHQQDVLHMDLDLQGDLVFSVGLIEHFDEAGTRDAVDGHLRLLRPGGLLIVTFPTPTWLYRATRGAAEAMGVWRFPDERPLRHTEVAAAVERGADVLYSGIAWGVVLTQMWIVARKR